MSIKLYILIAMVLTLSIGYIRALIVRNTIRKRIITLKEYQTDFMELSNGYFGSAYAAARHYDEGLYNWLVETSNTAQLSLASYPVPDFTGTSRYLNINSRLSIVLTIRKFSTGNIRINDVNAVNNDISSSLGYLKEIQSLASADLYNPIKWFQYGIKFILSTPIRLLNWFGIIDSISVDKITTNSLYRVISSLISLLAFVSSIITVFTGWGSFVKLVTNLIDRL